MSEDFLPDALDIRNYVADGFVKVCDVVLDYRGNWLYKNINEDYMFDKHKSWGYFIVVGYRIVKHGNSGNPLGIRSSSGIGQPMSGSKSRFGRYKEGDGTDQYIRESLEEEARQGIVSIWAKRYPIIKKKTKIAGRVVTTSYTAHDDMEKQILDYIHTQTGSYPSLNKCRK